MAIPTKKIPYYEMKSSAIPFTNAKWKEYYGSQGCVPLKTQKSVSMDKLAPGEKPPPPPKQAKPTPEQERQRKAEEQRQKDLAQQQEKLKKIAPKPVNDQTKQQDNSKQKEPEPVDEECENPPIFDMQDISDAMEKIKWPISAKLARKWFSGSKHIYDDNQISIQPIDDTTVTLDWALKFGSVQNKFDALLEDGIYSDKCILIARKKILKKIHEIFINENSTNLSFNTTSFLDDIRQFHIDWQFQLTKISTLNTTAGATFTPTDLSGSLGTFDIYVAIGNVDVSCDKYYICNSMKETKAYCIDPKVKITHVYVYVKDNYSFNDKTESNESQYLGHWNKNGFIITSGDSSDTLNWKNYWLNSGLDKPVDTRRGSKKFKEQDVYFPIHNKSYTEWREKHNFGGDFMIYSKPKYMKLAKPIEFSLETLCRPPEKL